jgi:serine/threonine protein kinase
MAKSLVVLAGPDEGRIFQLGPDPLLLGRSRATETKLIDPHVSRVHCQILLEGEQYVISDFDSAGGTFVNGRRITKQALQSGDLIRIGGTRLQYADDGNAAQTTTKIAAPTGGTTVTLKGNWARQLPGQKFSHYKIGSLLAQGKTGYVFHARDMRKNVDLALKILDPRYGASDEVVKRFVEAMKTVLPLRHPNLVKVYGAGKSGPHCWVAMEYVSGESLAAVIGRIDSSGPLDWRQVVRVVVYLTRALVYAHGKNIIHQCVTPQNILLGKNMPHTKLADLMLASAIERDPTVPMDESGEPSDDLPYMSPERTDGPGKPVDARTDLYSLGATAFALLAGKPPFQGNTTQDLINRIRLQAPPSLQSVYPGLPEPVEFLILKMLAKRLEDRPKSAKELLQEVETLAKGSGIGL